MKIVSESVGFKFEFKGYNFSSEGSNCLVLLWVSDLGYRILCFGNPTEGVVDDWHPATVARPSMHGLNH